MKLVFNINEGPKVKVGEITVVGNHAFSTRKIIRAMRHDRPVAIPLGFNYIPIMAKTFDRPKLDEDLEVGVRGLYNDHGYMKADVEAKDLKTVDLHRGGIPGGLPVIGAQKGKATNITISIEEGPQYRMGRLTVRSADQDQGLVIRADYLQKFFPLKEGDIFDADRVRKSLDNYRKLYGEVGYIDFTAEPMFDFDDVKKIINLTLVMDQQKQYFVRRIDFSGNTTTRDKVIRRELLLDEGQVFNNRLWELSILRLNQLGYFEAIKPDNAELKRNTSAGTVDINLKVKEKGKQSISFNGGVSGFAGTFIGFSYQTNNFLGLGETLTLSAQIGNIQSNVQFGFTEPYLFDRPISSGFTVFFSRLDYNTARQEGLLFGQQVAINPALQENYNTDSKGFTFFSSYPIRKFSKAGFARLGLTYGFSTTDITPFSQSATLLFELTRFTGLGGPNALKGIEQSQITPTFTYDSRNSPVSPTQGKSVYLGTSFVGGPIGGNVNTVSENFQMSYFHPHYQRVRRQRDSAAKPFLSWRRAGRSRLRLLYDLAFRLHPGRDDHEHHIYESAHFGSNGPADARFLACEPTRIRAYAAWRRHAYCAKHRISHSARQDVCGLGSFQRHRHHRRAAQVAARPRSGGRGVLATASCRSPRERISARTPRPASSSMFSCRSFRRPSAFITRTITFA